MSRLAISHVTHITIEWHMYNVFERTQVIHTDLKGWFTPLVMNQVLGGTSLVSMCVCVWGWVSGSVPGSRSGSGYGSGSGSVSVCECLKS